MNKRMILTQGLISFILGYLSLWLMILFKFEIDFSELLEGIFIPTLSSFSTQVSLFCGFMYSMITLITIFKFDSRYLIFVHIITLSTILLILFILTIPRGAIQ